jgi:peroxiredoxin family protein
MSMEAMGVEASELREGTELGGVADFLAAAAGAKNTLFI